MVNVKKNCYFGQMFVSDWKILSVGEPLLQAEITSKPKARLSTKVYIV